ncbi:ornithine decarboxylase [Mycena rosella]|uniref:ornithine decarboxylase n=1 Tax=Mycena rosella TaxID=1033263 RepID=A0AAD7GJJ8_MYCRO|nr:ornithine decarboxylase [Mycena rosella]
MSQVQVHTLRPTSPLTFNVSQISRSDSLSFPPTSRSDSLSFRQGGDGWALVNDLSSLATLHLTASQLPGIDDDDDIFPSLPPLLDGHPDIHLRNGIMNASVLAAKHDPDAEKAFFVGDLSQVYRQHLRWQACLPDIRPFYAVKCNPDPYVLRLLAALGAGFDCASNGEISQVLALGVDPSRVIYANPCKATSFVREAGRVGVDMMTFDNADELHKIARAHPNAQLVVRILTDDTKSLCALGVKFGAPLATVPGLLAKAKELNLNVVGVSFHVGSGCYDPSVLLDVGGGFEDALFEQTAANLTEAIAFYFPDRSGFKIIAEPGRFYVATAFRLAANIIARRAPLTEAHRDDAPPSDKPSVMYYINDGVYGAFNCILFDHQTARPYVLSMADSFHIADSEPLTISSVWGPTCDSIDCVCLATPLPSALRVGDWLGFDNMGAYTSCAASQFNVFEVSKVVYTTGGGFGASEVRSALARFAAEGHGL